MFNINFILIATNSEETWDNVALWIFKVDLSDD